MLTNLINTYVDQYLERVSVKYSIDKQELLDMWENNAVDVGQTYTPCNFKFSKKSKACTARPIEGSELCQLHYNRTNKKVLPKPKHDEPSETPVKKSSKKSKRVKEEVPSEKREEVPSEKKEEVPSEKKEEYSTPSKEEVKKKASGAPQKAKKELILRKHKHLGVLWDSETSLYFEDKVVVGKVVDGELQALTEDDVGVCRQRGFAYKQPVETKECVKKLDMSQGEDDLDERDLLSEDDE